MITTLLASIAAGLGVGEVGARLVFRILPMFLRPKALMFPITLLRALNKSGKRFSKKELEEAGFTGDAIEQVLKR